MKNTKHQPTLVQFSSQTDKFKSGSRDKMGSYLEIDEYEGMQLDRKEYRDVGSNEMNLGVNFEEDG